MPPPVDAVTLDFYQTLAFHREGRGRGRVLMEYLDAQGLEPSPWEHQVLYDVFAVHDEAYSPDASAGERRAYHVALAGRVLERLGIRASGAAAAGHAEAVWRILGPASLGVFPDVLETLRTLHVGDTYVDDYVGASSAGLRVVLIDRTGSSGWGDVPTIRDLSELLDFVDKR
jgi:FMN phosphatase YigB (HAD superfamily)